MIHKELLEWERLSLRYDENAIPLYLSYPVESFWKQERTAAHYIEDLESGNVSFLYFHFPFCKTICHYCMCYKKALTDDGELGRYNAYLTKEIEQKARYLEGSGWLGATHMHWGGGTPTLLNIAQLETIHEVITQRLGFFPGGDTEQSIEAFPDESIISREKLQTLRNLGFNVISFGIQDFDPRIQRVINRRHDPGMVRELIGSAKDLGFRVHVDLCYGLPFQGINELERTIEEITPAAPSRICIFPYAHVPLIFPRQNIIPRSSIPNSFIKVLMAEHADRLLVEHGYVRLGLDHYLKADDPFLPELQESGSKTLMGYSQNSKLNYLGFGATAISFFSNTFYRNVTSLDDYYRQLDDRQMPIAFDQSFSLSEDDRIRSALMLDCILTRFEIDVQNFEKSFGIMFNDYFAQELDGLSRFEEEGLVDLRDPDFIRITRTGQFFSRHIANVFDRFYNRLSNTQASG